MNWLENIKRLKWLRTHFRRTFNGPDGKLTEDGRAVLVELRRFCYGSKPTIKMGSDGRIDPYASIAAAGRQEVYMRVVSMLNLDDTDLAFLEKRAREMGSEVANG